MDFNACFVFLKFSTSGLNFHKRKPSVGVKDLRAYAQLSVRIAVFSGVTISKQSPVRRFRSDRSPFSFVCPAAISTKTSLIF